MTLIRDYAAFFESLPYGTRVIISGGDGTLNRFINDTINLSLSHDIYYYASGSGNDFLRDEMGYRNAIEQHFYVYKKLIYDRAVLGEQNKGQSQ